MPEHSTVHGYPAADGRRGGNDLEIKKEKERGWTDADSILLLFAFRYILDYNERQKNRREEELPWMRN